MIFIFGWGHVTQKALGPTYPANCRDCHGDTYWHLTRLRTWFTLFFIPVIPYQTDYVMHCEECGNGFYLNGDQTDRALLLNEASTQYFNQEISKEEYEEQLDEVRI